MKIVIPMLARSKKNNERIVINQKTGKPFIIQSDLYKKFEQDCGIFLKRYARHIDYPINLKVLFYVPNRKKRDLTNLLNGIQDILIKYDVIVDDNSEIVESVDGSRIIYEKDREETIIEITEVRDGKQGILQTH